MILNLIRKFVKKKAIEQGKFKSLYFKLCKPNNAEYADFLKRHGGLHSMGSDCEVNLGVTILDPYLVRLGNNVSLSTCTLVGHDGSISVLNKAYGVKLDSVGPIDIQDNVFVGFGAIILPNTTIGNNSIIAAGAVVSGNVEPGTIVGGVPAKPIGKVNDLVKKLQEKTDALPWADMIKRREGGFDPVMEVELRKQRIKYFW